MQIKIKTASIVSVGYTALSRNLKVPQFYWVSVIWDAGADQDSMAQR